MEKDPIIHTITKNKDWQRENRNDLVIKYLNKYKKNHPEANYLLFDKKIKEANPTIKNWENIQLGQTVNIPMDIPKETKSEEVSPKDASSETTVVSTSSKSDTKAAPEKKEEAQEDVSSGKPSKAGLYVVCNGAECSCNMSDDGTKGKLKVLSQNKIYVNDKEGAEKLVANTNDLGIPFEVPVKTFGKCKMQPTGTTFLPCIPNIAKWSEAYDPIVLENKGKALVDTSEGTCAFGGKITFDTHGQTQAVSQQDVAEASNDVATLINPALTEEDVHELIAGKFKTKTEDEKGASVATIKTEDNKNAYQFTKPDIAFTVKKYSSKKKPTDEQKAGINWAVFYRTTKKEKYKEVGKYVDIGETFDFPFQTQGDFVVEAYGGAKGPYYLTARDNSAYKKITLGSQKLTGVSGPFVGKSDRSAQGRVRINETVTIKAGLLYSQKDVETALSGKEHMKGIVWEATAYKKIGKTKKEIPVTIVKDKNNPQQITIAPLAQSATRVTVTATNPKTGAVNTLKYSVGSNYVVRVKQNKETICVWDTKEAKKKRHTVTLEVAKYAIEPALQAEKDAVKWTSYCKGDKPLADKIIATGHSTTQISEDLGGIIYEAYGIYPSKKGGETASAKLVTVIAPRIIKAYWADKNGNQIHRSGFKHEVYIHIETEGLTGEKLELNIWESDNKTKDDFVKNAGTAIEVNAKNGIIHQAFTLPENHFFEQEYFFTIKEFPCVVAGAKQDSGCKNEYVLWNNWENKKTHYLYVDKDEKIVNLRMYESNGKLHTGIVKYGDCITVKVATRNYVGKTLEFKIYEDINWAKDPKKNETIKIPIDKQGKGETEFMVPTAWESDHKDACTARYFYLEHNGDDFPRSFYIKTKGKEEDEVESKPRVRALMLKVSTTLELDEKLEADNAVVLGEELNVPTGSGKACESLIWGEKFTCEEREKVIQIASDLWGEDKKIKMANNLMAVFAWESGGTFKTNAPNMDNSGGTGLIQFMPKTAKSLLGRDITIEYVKNYWGKEKTLKRVKEFANMTVLKQLDYVKKYFKPQAGKDLEFVDFYLQVLFPASSGKKNHVVFSENGEGLDVNDRHFKLRVKAYAQNKGMDADKNGKLMKNEIALSVQKYLIKGEAFKNDCSDGSCTLGAKAHDGEIIKNGVTLHFIGKTAKESSLSIKTKNILKEVGEISSNMNIYITSVARTAYDQARIMYDNCSVDIEEQRATYATAGQKVIDVYLSETKKGKTREKIILLMEQKIKELGPASVSKHCSDPNILNTFDISYSKLNDKNSFWEEMKKRSELDKILKENKCYHIQIEQ
ncbi:DUF4280 domain-containing protein [Tenacibaculum ovolyticum]|uniref:DUF4280 domain-containing protein n=1 Tax=Tenacibaculum ovolyticum TaxID=104270 RepID=UPI0004022463|nr:DUF4280 domain-containing protein [Tenacibaculum ovolyticum]